MERTFIKDLKQKVGQEAAIFGWVQTNRDQGSIKFFVIRDITGTIQTVVLKENKEAFEIAEKLTTESVVEITGEIKEEKQAPDGIEIKVKEIKILSLADPGLPIQVVEKSNNNEAEQQIRLDWRWIDLRKPEKVLIFKVWTEMEQAFRNYCISSNYIEIHSPKTLITSTESGSELFEVKYFGKKAYLAQSPQLYKQMAMVRVLKRCLRSAQFLELTRLLLQDTILNLQCTTLKCHL